MGAAYQTNMRKARDTRHRAFKPNGDLAFCASYRISLFTAQVRQCARMQAWSMRFASLVADTIMQYLTLRHRLNIFKSVPVICILSRGLEIKPTEVGA